ncbi:MAG: hypothetical protein A3K90_06935 [Pelodictyon luteolum]|uniref:Uncharacterized protein n=2 Tax=Pelodictyon luteolum TaxID=1100 RepID=Q3B2Z3_CHLL3|nr:hypothetical protein [Pelodictyon luteolum]ABB24288.1 conserved hypothetical protein [Pelodictyon luteolum DSM 273]KZK73956.1 MAG: hypothetical protein A3K90_06935 [Pelodictyon luteolum]
MILILLLLALGLLLAIFVMLFTGWPGRERKAVEEIGRELRREMAQQRVDSMQLLHAMKIELEESLRESIEQEVSSLAAAGTKRRSQGRKGQAPHSISNPPSIDTGDAQREPSAVLPESTSVDDGDEPMQVREEDRGQLALFAEPAAAAPLSLRLVHPDPVPPPEEDMIRVYAADDLPDVD